MSIPNIYFEPCNLGWKIFRGLEINEKKPSEINIILDDKEFSYEEAKGMMFKKIKLKNL